MLKRSFLNVVAILFLLPALSMAEGILSGINGTSLIKNPGQGWHQLKEGESAQEGTVLWIGASSSVVLKAGNDAVELYAGSEGREMTIIKLLPLEFTGTGINIKPIGPPLPPTLLSPADKFRTREPNVGLAWFPSLKEALYRIQISIRPDFSKIVAEEKSYNTEKTLEKFGPGIFYWRVSAINKDGIEGGFSEIRSFEIRSLPEPPSLGSPASTKTSTTFRWKRGNEEERYRLQISRKKDFTETDVDLRSVEGPRITVGTLDEGDYFVRVSAIDEDGVEGRFSEPQPFYVGPKVPSSNVAPLMIMLGVAAMLVGIH